MKVGNFTLSFTDLSVPVAGLPIDVIRTYDSREKRTGDFGVGWTLGVKNVRVEKSGVLGSNWEQTVTQAFLPTFCLQATKVPFVTVTFPDGRLYKFQASLGAQCQLIAPFESATVRFNELAGSPGTQGAQLVALDATDVFVVGAAPGDVEMIDAETADLYNPTRFQLTTAEGYVYVIDQKSGLQRMVDPNGNTVNVSASGIIHSAGKSITFTRDALGRITKITDPLGAAMSYTYDAKGDLVSFKDRENAETTFTYNSSHGLLSFNDPRGIVPARNEYDDSGRLVRQVDASGRIVTYSHDLDARREVITDRLGATTVIEYDAHGNVVRTTDAQGGITTRTYDTNDNVLSEISALGDTRAYTYDAQGNRLSVKDPLGKITRYTYNSRRQVLTVTDPLGHVSTKTYDANGNLTTTKDALGNTTTTVYNALGQPISSTNALSQTTSFDYDGAGNLTRHTDQLGNVTSYTYDTASNRRTQSLTRTFRGATETLTTTYEYDHLSRPVKVTNPDGSTAETVYDGIGKPSATVDALGHRTTYDYNDAGQLIRTTFPDGTKEENSYDAEGRRTRCVDRAGRAITYTYDTLGRLEKTTNADGTSMTSAYDALGRVTSSTDERGKVVRFEYDAAGQKTKVTDAQGRVTVIAYDAAGNQVSVTDAKGQTTRFEYDVANHRTRTVYPDGTARVITYDAVGKAITKTDQAGKSTQFGYDSRGKLTQVTDALNGVTRYAYDEAGNRLSQTDANGHVTTFEYDRLGRRLKRTLPAGMSETYSYDAAGNLTARVDFRGKRTTYAYDEMNRLLSKTPDASLGEPGVTFTYTATGRRATMTDASGTSTYDYDARERLKTKATPQGVLTYSYDDAGNLLTLRSSHTEGVSVDYTYDDLGRLATVQDNRLASGTTTYDYDANGNLASTLYPNAVKTAYTYDNLNRLTQLSAVKGVTLASFTYTLGAAGERRSIAETGGRSVNYTYDALYRLTEETINDGVSGGTISYTYDAVGNRLRRDSTVAPVAPSTSTYDANDRLTADVSDPNGNTISANGVSYSFDFEDRLSSAGNGAVNYVYDGDGNRVSSTVGGVTTTYVVDTNNPTGLPQVVEELQGSTVVRQYTYGHDLISQRQSVSGQRVASFYGYDGSGSVRYLTNAVGTVTDTYTYDAFGNLIATTGTTPNVYLFAGEQFDQNLGFYYLRARYMNPNSGRFQTMDTFEGTFGDPQSLHKYLYANASPTNVADPTGHMGDFSIGGLMNGMAIRVTLFAIQFPRLVQTIQFVAAVVNFAMFVGDADYRGEFVAGSGGPSDAANILAQDAAVIAGVARSIYSIAAATRTTTLTAAEIARSMQGNPKYPNIDKFFNVGVRKGDIVYAGTGGSLGFFTTERTILQSGGDATVLFEGLQVAPFGDPALYRSSVTAYEITEDCEAAFGFVGANPRWGDGGFAQLYIPNAAQKTRPVGQIFLHNRESRIPSFESR
jgi:RHS repeat-associated protein